MSTHKHIDTICLVAALLALVLCAVFMNGEVLGIQAAPKVMGYEDRLFDTSKVHTIDIVIDDWEGFLETAQSEEYSACSVVIDGETISNVGIRGKGNTSLSSVASMNSDRYSFKIEFDQYDSSKTYHGLDKLSLNNVIQDNTYMKDYLTYQMMGEFGAPAPLCSYVWITVNGEDWGLYLAVEAVEESFLQRNYGSNYGDLYKPDSLNMGGGRGNGQNFEMPDMSGWQESADTQIPDRNEENRTPDSQGDRNRVEWPDSETGNGEMPSAPENIQDFFSRGGFSLDESTIRAAFEELGLGTAVLDGIDFENISMETIQTVLSDLDSETMQKLMEAVMGGGGMKMPDMGDFGGFGMGSSDVKLQYIDDDPDSYSSIFDSAKTDVTDADQTRLIASLKQLSEYENLEEVINIEDVLRYFVVHNYVVNGDSYTGSMIHNYYLYEEDGQLSMIPWDYNLAFGTFTGGSGSSSVNEDIDEVLSDRPMQAWIFSDETYTERYYALYAELLEQVDMQAIIDDAYQLIAPYVETDPTAFCTYTEFRTGVETLKEFCALRSESVQLQLAGSTETVDAGTLNVSAMGSMGGRGKSDTTRTPDDERAVEQEGTQQSGGMQMPEGMQMPGGMQFSGGMEMPNETIAPGGTSSTTTTEPAADSSDQGSDSSVQGTNAFPDGMDGFENFSPFGEMPDSGSMGSFGGMMNNGQDSGTSITSMILLAASILILAVGLIVAFKFKR